MNRQLLVKQQPNVSADQRAEDKPALLLVGNFLSATSGTRGVGEDLALRLSDTGWQVYTTSQRSARFARLSDMLVTTWRMRRHYALAQVDVYSGPAFIWAEAVCRMLRLLGKPYILTLHGGNLPCFAQRRPGRVQRLLRSAAAVTTPSHYLFEQMNSYCSDLRLLPNPLALECYTYRTRIQPQPRLVWLRAFHTVYNPALAPQVVAELVRDVPDIHLLMIGPDKGDGSLAHTHAMAAKLHVAGHMTFHGAIPKSSVPEWMHRGDIFLNTTNVDNTPVTVMEAMACGLCVVSTNVGGISYLLQHEQDALLVPPRDPGAMAAAVRRILTEPGLAEHLSRNARKKVEQFDWSAILPQWEALLADTAKEQSR
jgi:glycosyltransferase involved in cell wall biosynthesis